MGRTKWRHETPSVFVNGREFLVDFGAREFRCVSDAFRGIDVHSAQGRRFLDELMILTCNRCGFVAVELRYVSGVKCGACRAWLLV